MISAVVGETRSEVRHNKWLIVYKRLNKTGESFFRAASMVRSSKVLGPNYQRCAVSS